MTASATIRRRACSNAHASPSPLFTTRSPPRCGQSAARFYLLLHGNRDYLDYSLSRTDPETILVPLLRVLHDSKTLPINR